MKRVVLLAAAVMLLAPHAFGSAVWLNSLPAAVKQAKEKKQNIFVDLFADWCGWCHQLEQQVFPSQVFQKATDDYVLLRLNTEDGGDGTKMAQMFAATSLPTSLLVTPDMQLVGMVKGFRPPDAFARAIGEEETTWNAFQKRVANEKSIAKDPQKRLDLAREWRNHRALMQSTERFKKLTTDANIPEAVRDQAYVELALTQAMDSKVDEALKTLRRFSTVQDKGDMYEKSRIFAGELYALQGNFLGAVNELKNFKTKFPKSPLIANVDMILPQYEKRLNGQVQ